MCGLSHKQRWRRQAVGLTKVKMSESSSDDSLSTKDTQETNDETNNPSEAEVEKMQCDSVTPMEVEEECMDVKEQEIMPATAAPKVLKRTRSVRFFSAVSVVLIPSINEYKEAMLFDRLWWTKQDFRHFESKMVDDVKSYMGRTACMDYKIAMRMINSEVESHMAPDEMENY